MIEKYRIIDGTCEYNGKKIPCYIPQRLVETGLTPPYYIYVDILKRGSYLYKTSQNNTITEDQKHIAEMFIEIDKRKRKNHD